MSLFQQSQTCVVSHSNTIPFVGIDSEAVNVSSNTHKCTHTQVPMGSFPLIWILLNRRRCSRCEAAVRCVYENKHVCMCHQPYGLLVANYTHNRPHAYTQANQPPYNNTLAFTLSPKQLHYLENTRAGERTARSESALTLGWCSANPMVEAACNQQLSQSSGRERDSQ